MVTSPTKEKFPLSSKKVLKKTIDATSLLVSALLIAGGFLITLMAVSGGESAKTLIMSTVFIGLTILLITVSLTYLYQLWYFNTYFYDLTHDYIVIRKGTFSPKEITIPYERLQDVHVDQDLLDRIFGLYDVHISSATVTSGMEAHIDGVEKKGADGLRAILLDKVTSKISKSKNSTYVESLNEIATDKTEKKYPIQFKWVFKSFFSFTSGFVTIFILYIIAKILEIAIASLNTTTQVATEHGSGELLFYLFGLFLLSVFIFVRSILQRKAFRFAFGEEYLLFQEGILGKSQRHIPYGVVQNIIVKQDLFDRIFGIASLTIENASAGSNSSQIQDLGFGLHINLKTTRQKGIETVGSDGSKTVIPGLLKQDAESLKGFVLQKMKEHPMDDNQSGL